MQIQCNSPQVIIHPLAYDNISKYKNYYIRDVEYKPLNCLNHLVYEKSLSFLSPNKNKISRDDIEHCYVVDSSTGERYPLYMEVPCGHCEICSESKVNSFVHRCKLETMCYDCKPIFLTLTYNEENKPKNGVSVRHVQLFFKRLRINLQRAGYRERLRYVLVAEYGRNTHRPHYHAILWNLHASDLLDLKQINQILEKSWHNGFILSRFVEPSNDKAFYYTAKYLRKDCDVPSGCSETFVLSSRGNGGIGKPYLKQLPCSIVERANVNVRFLNKFSSKSEPIQFNRYIINHLLPSFSRSLPVGIKTDLRNFMLSYYILKNIYHENTQTFEKKAKKYYDFFGKYFFVPDLESSKVKTSLVHPPQWHWRTLLCLESKIERAYSLGDDFYRHAEYLDTRRQVFLYRLFENSEDLDLSHKSVIIRRKVARSKQLEIL